MNTYEEKQEQRRQRLEAAADRRQSEGESRVARAHEMASVIPFGQPILVGHHSENRDRNYRARIHSGFGKGFELQKEAGELRAKAAAVGTGGVSSDDPAAPNKIRERIEGLTRVQNKMREANRLLRKGDDVGLSAIGFTSDQIAKLKEPDAIGRPGFADYQLSNNSANIRRLTLRLAALAARPTETKEETVGDVRIVENADANRLQLFFPGKPDEATRKALKGCGFRWAWQRQLSNAARDGRQSTFSTGSLEVRYDLSQTGRSAASHLRKLHRPPYKPQAGDC